MDCSLPSMVIATAVTMLLSICLTALVRGLAKKWRIVDRPDAKRKLHQGRMPLWGGVAVYLAMVLGLLVASHLPHLAAPPLRKLVAALIPAAGLACFFGALDDLWQFSSRRKLILQFLAVLPVVAAGFWIDRIVVFGCPIALGWAGIPLTIVWLLGCINALNLIDGMDGLASLVGLSTAMMMGVIAASMGNNHVAVMAAVLAAALAGFLVYNLPPASIFLGDSGSALIGLVLGILGIQGAMKTSATLAITAPAVLMTLPLLDVVLAVVRRTLTGRSFAAADRQHIHHCLLDRGLRPWQVLGILGGLPDHGSRRHRRHCFSLGRLGLDHRRHADRADDPPAAIRPLRIRAAQGRHCRADLVADRPLATAAGSSIHCGESHPWKFRRQQRNARRRNAPLWTNRPSIWTLASSTRTSRR